VAARSSYRAIVEQRFNWETESQHQQLINKVKEWRSKGKVNWKDEIT
jgi:hypothetical protein